MEKPVLSNDDNVRTEELPFHKMETGGSVKQTCSIPKRKLRDGLIFFLGQKEVKGFNDEKHIYIQEPKNGVKPAQWQNPTDGVTLTGGKIPYRLVGRKGFNNLRDYLEKYFSDEGYDTCFELKKVINPDKGKPTALHLAKKPRNVHHRQYNNR